MGREALKGKRESQGRSRIEIRSSTRGVQPCVVRRHSATGAPSLPCKKTKPAMCEPIGLSTSPKVKHKSPIRSHIAGFGFVAWQRWGLRGRVPEEDTGWSSAKCPRGRAPPWPSAFVCGFRMPPWPNAPVAECRRVWFSLLYKVAYDMIGSTGFVVALVLCLALQVGGCCNTAPVCSTWLGFISKSVSGHESMLVCIGTALN